MNHSTVTIPLQDYLMLKEEVKKFDEAKAKGQVCFWANGSFSAYESITWLTPDEAAEQMRRIHSEQSVMISNLQKEINELQVQLLKRKSWF